MHGNPMIWRPSAIAPVLLAAALAVNACGGHSKGCDKDSLAVSGELSTSIAAVPFDQATATLVHRRDVDEWEDGAITSVKIELKHGGGCRLTVTAGGCLDAKDRLAVTSVALIADSRCPGFPEDSEGLYVSALGVFPGTAALSVTRVPGKDAASVCFKNTVTLELSGDLMSAGTGEVVSVQPSTLTVTGDFVSEGDPEASAICRSRFVADTAEDPSEDVLAELSLPDLYAPDGVETTAVKVVIECPECTGDDLVKFYGSPGQEIGNPQFVHFFTKPEFPIEATLDWATNSVGDPFDWPAGSFSFQAYQDTIPGGLAPEEGEPASQIVTVELVTGKLNQVSLVLEGGGKPPFSCPAGGYVCLSLQASAHCGPDGESYEEEQCSEEQSCNEISGQCQDVVCQPSALECASPSAHHTCLDSGTGWAEEVACDAGYACLGGACIDQACLGQVLLLVDTSISMGLHWEAVSASLLKLVGLTPLASFALDTFPIPDAVTGCEVDGSLEIDIGPGQEEDMEVWFTKHGPFGKTPLVAAMQDMEAMLPGVFGEAGGALVVLSDGEDTCAYQMMADLDEREALIESELAEATANLFQVHGVKTFVIGYNYDGNPGQLIAIVQNGGTGKDTFTTAGNEQELTSVLVSIVEDLKLCISPE